MTLRAWVSIGVALDRTISLITMNPKRINALDAGAPSACDKSPRAPRRGLTDPPALPEMHAFH